MNYLTIKGYDLSSIAQAIVNKINATKRVSRDFHDVALIERALRMVFKINELPWYASSVDGVPLELIKVPQFLESFVIPSKVSLESSSLYPDLRFVSGLGNDETIDIAILVGLSDIVYQMFKTEPKLISVSERRQVETLSNCNQKAILVNGEWRVNLAGDQSFVPILLINAVSPIIGEHAVNESADYVMQDFFLKYRID